MAKRSRRRRAADGGVPLKDEKRGVTAPDSSREWLWGVVLMLAVILIYQPVWYAGYIWDDDVHLTANPCIIGPLGLKEIWTTASAQFFPLVLTTFWIEHAVWGLAPLPYHLVNVFLHGAGAVVLWRILRLLEVPGACLGAALWAVHPMQVESVAWISELKNTQSCLFYLLTILFFVRWLKTARKTSGEWNYALSVLCAALAMASKSPTAVLPAVLGLCVWRVESRWHRRHLARLAPFFLMSAAACAITVWPRTTDGAAMADLQWARSWPQRVATVGDAIWFYLGKLVWPHPLMVIYPRWAIDGGNWVSYLPLLAAIIVFCFLWLKRGSRFRPVFFALAYFLVVLSPFLGLIDQSFWRLSLVEDHLQYLAGMGPLALVGAGIARLADPARPWLQPALAAAVLMILGIMSRQRAGCYLGEETLWSDTLAKNPACWLGHYNLGVTFYDEGRTEDAKAEIQKALALNPNYDDAHYGMGNIFLQTGKLNEAITEYRKAVALNADYDRAHNNLGFAFYRQGRLDEAIAEYQKAIALNPNYDVACSDLGIALAQKGRVDEAIAQYRRALEINPHLAAIHNNLGKAFLQKGDAAAAAGEFAEVVRLNANDQGAQNNLAKARAMLSRGSGSK